MLDYHADFCTCMLSHSSLSEIPFFSALYLQMYFRTWNLLKESTEISFQITGRRNEQRWHRNVKVDEERLLSHCWHVSSVIFFLCVPDFSPNNQITSLDSYCHQLPAHSSLFPRSTISTFHCSKVCISATTAKTSHSNRHGCESSLYFLQSMTPCCLWWDYTWSNKGQIIIQTTLSVLYLALGWPSSLFPPILNMKLTKWLIGISLQGLYPHARYVHTFKEVTVIRLLNVWWQED